MWLVTVIADTQSFKGEVLTGDGVQRTHGPSRQKLTLWCVCARHSPRGAIAAVQMKRYDLFLPQFWPRISIN